MKHIRIYRDLKTGRLGYRVLDDGKLVHEELSTQTDIRKLRRSLRRALGKSLIMEGLGA
jgi:hypothetical protein